MYTHEVVGISEIALFAGGWGWFEGRGNRYNNYRIT